MLLISDLVVCCLAFLTDCSSWTRHSISYAQLVAFANIPAVSLESRSKYIFSLRLY